jgi:hypothetical protein
MRLSLVYLVATAAATTTASEGQHSTESWSEWFARQYREYQQQSAQYAAAKKAEEERREESLRRARAAHHDDTYVLHHGDRFAKKLLEEHMSKQVPQTTKH